MPRPVDHLLREQVSRLMDHLTAQVDIAIARIQRGEVDVRALVEPLRREVAMAYREHYLYAGERLEEVSRKMRRRAERRAGTPPPFPRDDQTPTRAVTDRDLDETRSFRVGPQQK